ncbi:MAG: phenylacetate--CoA ligase family protein [Rhodocyclaceae bacterium]|nr:phenylacetate--CoA ligase family protein [Rhodocyclaceae bacterium]MBX3667636.1 phenylacetate--CoA ligase family protein [Rhodocyclaceae bacterium]
MSLYTAICSNVIFPLHERLKHHDTLRRLRELEQSQWWPAERIRAMQAERLRNFLCDIGRHVPYYRELFAARGFDPASVRDAADLAALPALTKSIIRAQGDAMKAVDAGPMSRYNTGGSSGEPLIFYIGKARKSHDVAAKWRATRWWSVDIGDPEIVLWGSPIELGAQDRVKAVRDRLLRTWLLPAFEMSDAKVDGFLERIIGLRPRHLFGYPSAFAHIAARARARKLRMDQLGIRVVFVTSEKLYDHQRKLIEETFGCPVANGYGGRDAGFLAHQCPHGRMHLTAEDIVVEILDADGNPQPAGVAGEITVTHCATRDFPFLRYRTGDVGVLSDEKCPCGRGLPILADVQGRTTDFVVAQDGTVMHGLALIYTVRDLPGVEKFKIIQHALDHTEVQLVTGPAFAVESEERIRRDYAARLGAGVKITLTRVADIAPERSGKFRYVVSKVSPSVAADGQAAT